MNVAFSAVVLFALVLPGFLFRQSFLKAEGEYVLLDFKPFGRATVAAFVWAVIFHAIALGIVDVFTAWRFDADTLLRLLAGERTTSVERALDQSAQHWNQIALYFTGLAAAAWLLGSLLRRLVTSRKWDRSDSRLAPVLRFDTPWYYLLTGYDEDEPPHLVVVTTIVQVGAECFLYRGILVSFFLDSQGQLDRVVLTSVERRPIQQDRTDADPHEERFYPIDGDRFVIRYAQMITLNVSYGDWITEEEAVG